MDLKVDSKTDELVQLRIDGDIRGRFPSDPTKTLTELLGKDAYKNRVLVSFENVKYVDSNGLAWLVVCHKRFGEGGGALVLHTLPDVVKNVMKIVRLDQVFLIGENVQDATRIAMDPNLARPPADDTNDDDTDVDVSAEDTGDDNAEA